MSRLRAQPSLLLGAVRPKGEIAAVARAFETTVRAVDSVLLFLLDGDGTIITWNAGAERVTGFSAKDITGRDFAALFPEPDGGGAAASLLELARQHGSARQTGLRMRRSGAQFWSQETITATPAPGDRCTGFMVVAHDITQQRAMAEAAEAAAHRLGQLLETVQSCALLMIDPGGAVVIWGPGAEAVMRCRAEQIVGRSFRTFYTAQQIAGGRPEQELESAAARGRLGCSAPRLRYDGSTFWAHTVISAIYDAGDDLAGFGVFIRDTTERANAQAAGHDVETRLRGVVDTALDGIVTISEAGVIQSFNPACEQLFGYRAREVVGKPAALLFSPPFSDQLDREFRESRAIEAQPRREVVALRQDGHTFPAELSLGHTRLPDFGVFIATLRDVSALRTAEEETRAAVHEARLANQSKSQFLAGISHELRTPLNAIIGFADVIARQRLGSDQLEKYQEYARDILRSGEVLRELIDDLLDLSKIEADHHEVKDEPIAVAALLDEVWGLVQSRAAAKSIELEHTEVSAELRIYGEQRALRQVLANLISNAIKYTSDLGRVSVAVEPDAEGHLLIGVSDTGIGIAEKDILAIFDPYVRLDSARQQEAGGTGLGLSIVKTLVEMHDGEIRVESEPGRGSTFTVVLPARRWSESGNDWLDLQQDP